MNGATDQQIDELLRSAMADDAPSEVHLRLRSQLAELRARCVTGKNLPRPRRLVRSTWWGLGFSAAAVAALAVALALRPQSGFADAAAAMAEQPWVHARSHRAGRTFEVWYSLRGDVVATRGEGIVEYRDHRRDDFYRYDVKEERLYHLKEYRRPGENRFDALATAMTLLAQQERTLEKPLEQLGFLGPKRKGMRVLDQNLEKVTIDGQEWLDYRLSVSHPAQPEPVRMLFRVDVATKLPRLFRVEGSAKGERLAAETYFDYPSAGPADVFALGVPKSVTLVDRVPKGDLKRILDTLQTGRERMDDYRAIFVMHTEPGDHAWWQDLPYVKYRKGGKFRNDTVFASKANVADVARPAEDADLARWWQERLNAYLMYPSYVTRGSITYRPELKQNSDGTRAAEITGAKKYESNLRQGEAFPIDYSTRPEFVCRPPMGIGDHRLKAKLEMQPAEGPEGCILLRVLRADGDGGPNGDEHRYWLDPARDYIVRRWDTVGQDEQGRSTILDTHVIEEVAQSPSGVWYATKIRRPNSVVTQDGNRLDQVYYLYVDFDVDLPDSLFDAPRPGKIE